MKIAFLVAAALLVQNPPKPAGEKPPEPKPAETKPAESKGGLTGQVSEEEFKKMHELKKDAPPVLSGTPVDIAGTKGYLSLPKGAKAPMPAVIVIHEWWGLNDNVKHWADRIAAIASSGVVATVPP